MIPDAAKSTLPAMGVRFTVSPAQGSRRTRRPARPFPISGIAATAPRIISRTSLPLFAQGPRAALWRGHRIITGGRPWEAYHRLGLASYVKPLAAQWITLTIDLLR